MKIIICAATEMELMPIREQEFSMHEITFHTHGLGILKASYHIQKLCAIQPDLIIQIWVAGSYDENINLGSVFQVHEDCIGDLGAEDHNGFIDYTSFPFIDKNEFPFQHGKLKNINQYHTLKLPQVNSITVNSGAGNQDSIAYRKSFFNATLESMEGAALHYVCLQEQIPFLQIRGVSNYIEPRDTSKWKIELAIQNYSKVVTQFLNNLPK